jgi:hypothetical protein
MHKTLLQIFLLIAVFPFFFSGCTGTGNYGAFQRNLELSQIFLSYKVLPDYNYYTSGGYDKPNAILGVHKDYQLITDQWLSIPNADSAQVHKWISTIDPEDRGAGNSYFAYYILDPEGKQVGFWYSIQKHTVVKFQEENKIEVYTPDLMHPGTDLVVEMAL